MDGCAFAAKDSMEPGASFSFLAFLLQIISLKC